MWIGKGANVNMTFPPTHLPKLFLKDKLNIALFY